MSSVQSVHKWMMPVTEIKRHTVTFFIGLRALALYTKNLGISLEGVGEYNTGETSYFSINRSIFYIHRK